MTGPDDVHARERCTAIVNNAYHGIYAWYTLRALPPHTHRCDDDVDDFHVYDKGQARLCTTHGEMRRQDDAQTRGDCDCIDCSIADGPTH